MTLHFKYIDRLKGFAMLCVVLGHIVCFTMYDTWDIAVQDINLAFVNTFHMPLFMFLSGFVIHTLPNCKKLAKKCYSFLLPFLFFGGIYTYVSNGTIESALINEFKNGYWYLMVLAIFYCLLTLQKSAKNKWCEFIIPFVVYFILSIAVTHLPSNSVDLLSLGLCRANYPFFILGYFARKYNWMEWLVNNNWLFTIALLSFIPVYVMFHEGVFNHFIQILIILILIVILYVFKKRENDDSYMEKVLAFIGKNSLDVYVLHYFFFLIINLREPALWFKSTGNILIESIMLVVFASGISLLCIYSGKLLKQSNLIKKYVYGHF